MLSLSQLSLHIQFPEYKEVLLSQRLFHGRGHAYKGLKHITIDWLPPVILISLYAPEPINVIEPLAEWLLSNIPHCKSVQLQHRYQLAGPIDIIRGLDIHELSILEDNLRFHIRLGHSRNMGLFLDMYNGRQWVKEHSKNKRVLNLFAYTCGFSVAAISGSATSVLNIDLSSAALSIGRENHRLNQHSLSNVRFEKLNILKSFSRIKKRGPFDLLICDPPTFQKGSIDIIKDYPKIIRRLNEFMAPQAMLLMCLNSPDLNRDYIIDYMSYLAPQYQFIEQIKASKNFIDAEGKGLKVLYFKNS